MSVCSATYNTPCDWLNKQGPGNVINACCTCGEYMAIMWTESLQVRVLLRVASYLSGRIVAILTSKQRKLLLRRLLKVHVNTQKCK